MDTMEVVKEGDQKVCDAAGHLENIVGVTEDITEKVENVFVSTEEELEAMSQMKKRNCRTKCAGIIKVLEGLPNSLRVFLEGFA